MKTKQTHYTVGLIFTPDLTSVLLVRKNHPEILSGRLNGPGGAIRENEFPVDAMIRKLKDETGIEREPGDLDWIGDLSLPEDCTGIPGTCTLHFFATTAEKEESDILAGTEPISWHNTGFALNQMMEHPEKFCGNGDLAYFIKTAAEILNARKMKNLAAMIS